MLVPCPSFTPDTTKIYEDTKNYNNLIICEYLLDYK